MSLSEWEVVLRVYNSVVTLALVVAILSGGALRWRFMNPASRLFTLGLGIFCLNIATSNIEAIRDDTITSYHQGLTAIGSTWLLGAVIALIKISREEDRKRAGIDRPVV